MAKATPTATDQPTENASTLMGAIEAILLSIERPVSAARLAEAGSTDRDEPPTEASVRQAIESLNDSYESTGRVFRIEHVAGGYRLMTLPAYADAVAAFQRDRAPARLSRAGMETLAIIAYKQPVTRAELEAIRGVSCGEILKTLMDRRLVTITGRAEVLGRPMLYGTTRQFLDLFGLASIQDLPRPEEFVPADA
ncbi:MAG: SMC-Scp complex subunit ScpB [Phycisphaeraceae bacterium]|nr:SMC-Scp complex subunit ScpB [Phycisphaeraceae bacterium]